MKNPGIAAILSFAAPGIGQIYNGDFLWAIFWFIITPGFWVGSAGTLGFVCHIISAYAAYRSSLRHNLIAGYPELPRGDSTQGS